LQKKIEFSEKIEFAEKNEFSEKLKKKFLGKHL